MPRYTVEDQKTGKRITFDWNAPEPPSDADMEEVFSVASQQAPPQEKPSVVAQIAEGVGTAFSPMLTAAVKNGARAGKFAYENPRKAAEIALDQLPVAGSIVAPLAVTLPSGGAAVPAAVAASGAGAAGGEGLRQMGRRALGLEAAPPIQNPIPFTKNKLKRIPGVNPETSNLIEQAGIGSAGELVGQALKLVPPVVRKTIGVISPAKAEDIAIRYSNPKDVAAALTREQLGNSLVASMDDLSKKIGEADDAARALLSKEPTVNRVQLIKLLENAKAKFVGTAGRAIPAEAKAAVAEIDNAINGLASIGAEDGVSSLKNISEQQLKDVISQYRNIDWTNPARDAQKEIRNIMDQVLKSRNPEYAKSMRDVARMVKLQRVASQKFSLKYDPQTGTYATDATLGKWSPKLLEGGRPESSLLLKEIGRETGNDLLQKFKFTNVKEAFSGGKTQGSRMVNLGRYVGGVPGAVIGATVDKFGGALTGGAVDAMRVMATTPGSPLEPMTASLLAKTIGAAKQEENR